MRSMRGRWKIMCSVVLVFLGVGIGPGFVAADDAVVLPKGMWRLFNETQFFFNIDKRFNKDGNKEDIAIDLNANLNSSVFPALGVFGPGSNIGNSVVSFDWSIQQVILQPAFGLTDRLSIGANIFYFWQKNTVDASLNTAGATVGKNPFAVSPGNPLGLFPLVVPGTTPLSSADAQTLLKSQGFKELKTWEDHGFGDLEVGGKYQYFRSENFRAAFTGGARFPTGKVDDPDNLADRGFGAGAYAVLFRLHQDFLHQPDGLDKRLGFPGPGNFFINTTFRYDLYLPDRQKLRVCDIHVPLCPIKENVKRNIGDILEAEISGSYGIFIPGLFISPLYKFTHKFKDDYSGNMPVDYDALATESNFSDHSYRVTLTYSTIPLMLQKKFPLPLVGSVFYWDRFSGSNNRFVARSIGFAVATYF